ncbi:MAG TPA: symmetrical bis(5'-nucleosyl)-tetraphosphatase [Gammaproteobacteria bacterium]|nr:symmetrical bis(5'-nucleosyl)-tetraphosphatase [Gammaproteobacteria bacterium]
MATYAIGDVQGCYDELQALLTQIKFKSDRDCLWFCGDLVNRGPKSLETLRYIRALGDNAITVLGNHDLHLLATAYDHKKPGKKDTLNALLEAADAPDLLNWLRHRKLMHHDDTLNINLLHAGIHPKWSIDKARQLAREVEQVLQGEHHLNYYKHMYGDKPFNWDDKLSGWSRYRFITNIFTRLRYCDADGKPALSAKGAPGSQAENLYPWYEVPGRVSINDPIIFGHWSTLPHAGRLCINNTWAIDSGCLWGGALTAMRIDERPFVYTRLDCPGAQKPPEKYLKKSSRKKNPRKKDSRKKQAKKK